MHIHIPEFPEKPTTKKSGYYICSHIRCRSTDYIYQGQPFPWERLWSWAHCSGLTACTSAELPSVHSFPRPLSSGTRLGGHISTWRNQNVPTWLGLQASQSPFRKQQWLHPTTSGWRRTQNFICCSEVNDEFSAKPICPFERFNLIHTDNVLFRDRELSVTHFISMTFALLVV